MTSCYRKKSGSPANLFCDKLIISRKLWQVLLLLRLFIGLTSFNGMEAYWLRSPWEQKAKLNFR